MRISDWIQTCALPIYVTAGGAPLPVSFTGGASTDPDGDTLTYSWDFGDGAHSSAANPSHSYSATGTFTATLTITDGRGGSESRSIQITVGNSPPVLTMGSTASGLTDAGGENIALQGTATDPQDGTVTAS